MNHWLEQIFKAVEYIEKSIDSYLNINIAYDQNSTYSWHGYKASNMVWFGVSLYAI